MCLDSSFEYDLSDTEGSEDGFNVSDWEDEETGAVYNRAKENGEWLNNDLYENSGNGEGTLVGHVVVDEHGDERFKKCET